MYVHRYKLLGPALFRNLLGRRMRIRRCSDSVVVGNPQCVWREQQGAALGCEEQHDVLLAAPASDLEDLGSIHCFVLRFVVLVLAVAEVPDASQNEVEVEASALPKAVLLVYSLHDYD